MKYLEFYSLAEAEKYRESVKAEMEPEKFEDVGEGIHVDHEWLRSLPCLPIEEHLKERLWMVPVPDYVTKETPPTCFELAKPWPAIGPDKKEVRRG